MLASAHKILHQFTGVDIYWDVRGHKEFVIKVPNYRCNETAEAQPYAHSRREFDTPDSPDGLQAIAECLIKRGGFREIPNKNLSSLAHVHRFRRFIAHDQRRAVRTS